MRRIWVRGAVAVLGVLALATSASLAAVVEPNAAIPARSFTASERLAALRAIESEIEKTYVFPDLRPAIVARLERARQLQRYDVDDPGVFAQRITDDLRAASRDGHLYLASDPDEYAAAIAPPTSTAGLEARHHAAAQRDNSGLTKMEILPGNIRYLKITGFEWDSSLTATSYDDAARFLKDGDATIVDLRGNGGGNSDAADYFGIIPKAGKPLYILVDGHVASAAEAVAYGVQQARSGTIVGSTTYGAANNNKKIPIAPQFILSVSYNRPVNPISGTNWEGVGVKPDVEVSSITALDAAQLLALDRLDAAPTVTPALHAEYRWARVGVESHLHPAKMDRARLAGLAGNYGTIELRATEGGLRLYRSDRERWPQGVLLTPLTEENVYSVEGFDDALRLRLTGKTLELLWGSEDEREVFPRS